MTQPTPLASSDDVKAALGRDLTTSEALRVEDILRKASSLFRQEARQFFTPGTSDVRLKVNGGRVYLPERPVVSVASVTDDCGSTVAYTRRQQWLTTCLASDAFVIVNYDHGDVEVPDLVRTTVADIVRKVFTTSDEAVQGVSRLDEASGPFSESRTYAAWLVGGQTALSPEDKTIARSFRVRTPNEWVSPSPITPRWLGPNILAGL